MWMACHDHARQWGGHADEYAANAYFALHRACVGFDVNRGVKFSTYAVLSMERELRRHCSPKDRRKTKVYLIDDIAPDTSRGTGDWLGKPDDPDRDHREEMRHLANELIDLFSEEPESAESIHLLGRCAASRASLSIGLSRFGIGSRLSSIRKATPPDIIRRVNRATKPKATAVRGGQ